MLLAIQVAVWTSLVLLTILLVRAFDARRMPELKRWHRVELEAEFTADRAPGMDFADYLQLEQQLFDELEQRLLRRIGADERGMYNRYDPLAHSHASGEWARWNRTVVIEPDGRQVGGVLLLHGLTDSPYSMRAIAELFRARGYYVVALRLPGMGTVPAAAARVRWQDWSAAVRLAGQHVAGRLEPGEPFFVGGYSSGGLLGLQYALDAIEEGWRVPDRLVLYTPAIGITRFAMLGNYHKLLSWIPYFEQLAWGEIRPEYEPFKYTSFPKNAGRQGYLLSRSVARQLERIADRDEVELPPMLTFQSVVDATVSVPAVVRLYDDMAGPDSELVLFDINRYSHFEAFLRQRPERIEPAAGARYELTYVTNRHSETLEVVAERRRGAGLAQQESLQLSWPAGVYSLSHVAIPFSPDDPFYGSEAQPDPERLMLGSVPPRGERDMLTVPIEHFMRLRHNPFFDYVARRTVEFCMSGNRSVAPLEPKR